MSKQHSFGIVPYMIINGYYFILLNKTSKRSFFNFFKGKRIRPETTIETALREFQEETGIQVKETDLGEYFFQENSRKNIGVYLVDFSKYQNLSLL